MPPNGKKARKLPMPTIPKRPRAQEGQAGASKLTKTPTLPVALPPDICFLIKNMLIVITIPESKEIKINEMKAIIEIV